MKYKKLRITFKDGNYVTFKKDEWDDYSYDGKFFAVIHKRAWKAMYNAENVAEVHMLGKGED